MAKVHDIKYLASKKVSSEEIARILNVDINRVIEIRSKMRYKETIPIDKLTPKQRRRLNKLFEEGKSSRFITKEFNLNYNSLNTYLDQKYPGKRVKRTIVSKETKEAIYRMYEAGDSIEKISEIFKKSPLQILKYIKDAGLYKRKTKEFTHLTENDFKRIDDMFTRKMKPSEIAEELNVHVSTIYRIKKKKAQ